jgi:hypothetical protein
VKTTTVGTCIVCEREIAVRERALGKGMYVDGADLVHHGYRRPGDGAIRGDCFAVGMPPHELSTDAAESYRKDRVAALANERELLKELEANEDDSHHRLERVPVPTTDVRPSPLYYGSVMRDPGWRDELVVYRRSESDPGRRAIFADLHTDAVVRTKQRIEWCEREIGRMKKAIDTWVEKPLRERVEEPPKRRRRRRWVRGS